MQSKFFFLIIPVSIILVVSLYFFDLLNFGPPNRPSLVNEKKITESNPSKKTIGQGFFPFYLADASSEYIKVYLLYKNFKEQTYKNGAINFFEKDDSNVVGLYKKLTSFYEDVNNSNKERAYSLNMLNSVFITNFNSNTFKKGIVVSKKVNTVFNLNLSFVNKQKVRNDKIGKDVRTGAFMSGGNAADNYAAHTTLEYLDGEAYKLYPNSYSLVRQNLNKTQANLILYNNFLTGYENKSYSEFQKSKYTFEYFTDLENKLNKFKEEGKLYENLYSAAYEIDIATFNGILWPEFNMLFGDKSKQEEKKKIMEKSLTLSDHMLQVVKENQLEHVVYHAVLHSAIIKSAVVRTNLLEKTEMSKVLSDAQNILLDMFLNSKVDESLNNTIRNLQKGSLAERQMTFLGSINPKIQEYLNAIYK